MRETLQEAIEAGGWRIFWTTQARLVHHISLFRPSDGATRRIEIRPDMESREFMEQLQDIHHPPQEPLDA